MSEGNIVTSFTSAGTALSGCLCLCLKEAEVKGVEAGNVLCTNLFVGISQLTTVTFLLVGWFWSLAWGIYLVENASKLAAGFALCFVLFGTA